MSDTMQICGACGVVRAKSPASCPHCTAAYEGALGVPFRPDGAYWVCIECTFKCRACGFQVPLNHLDMDGGVLCARCGLEQAFDVSQWRTVLDHAHGTGDLWNDPIPYREHELVVLGDTRCSRTRDRIGDSDCAVVASPGQPLCEACHQPVDVVLDAESMRSGRSTVSCACGESATYEVSAAAQAWAPAIKAVIATEHRVDRKAVKVDQGAAAVAVACPSCNAPLEANESSKFLTCAYCHATSRIPDRTWFRISGKEPRPEPMWLLFRGASKEREGLEERVRDDERKTAERAQRSRWILAQEAERDQEAQRKREESEREKKLREEREELEARRKSDAERALRRRYLVVSVLAVPVVAVGLYFLSRPKPASTDPLTLANAACKAGDGKACDTAGALATDPSSSRRRYESACDAKYAPGCTHRGRVAEDATSYSTAESYYDQGCEGGDPAGCTALDALYTSGKKVPTDPPNATAARYYEKACNDGKVLACASGGLTYSQAGRVPRDMSRAAALFKKACDGGNAIGCDYVGQAYETGDGMPKDEKEMLRVYQKACAADAFLCANLGRAYRNGLGVPKDEAKAMGFFRKACSRGSNPGCAELVRK